MGVPSPFREARGVGYVCGHGNVPRQRELATEVQRVALIVVEKTAAAAKRKIGEATVDPAAAKSELVGIRKINMAEVVNARECKVSSQPLMRAPSMVIGIKISESLKLLWSKKLVARVRKLSASSVQP